MAPLGYSIVDLITLRRGIKRRIDGSVVRFPARWARFYPPHYDQQKQRFLLHECNPGTTVFDIGAHIGLYSVLMARAVGRTGRVISFEPSTRTRRVLEETVRLNHVQDVVTVRSEAVSISSGREPFYESEIPVSNANSFAPSSNGAIKKMVDTVSLDDFVVSRDVAPACLKIDVEGYEHRVLLGASNVLKEYRPTMAIELHPNALTLLGVSPAEVLNVLGEASYVVQIDGVIASPASLRQAGPPYEIQARPAEKR